MNRDLRLIVASLIALGAVAVTASLMIIPPEHVFWGLVVAGVYAFSIWMMHRELRIFNWRRLTIPAFWYVSYVIMIAIPAFLILFGVSPAGYPFVVRFGPHLERFFVAAQSVLITAPLGIFLINKLFGFKPPEIEKYFKAPIEGQAISPIVYFVIMAAAMGLTLSYFLEVKEMPLLRMFEHPGDMAYLGELREEAFAALGSSMTYAYSVLKEALYPFFIVVALGGYLYRRQKVWLMLFLLSLGTGIAYASVTIARGPVATIFLVVAAYLYLHMSGEVSLAHAVVALVVILIFPVFIILMISPSYGLNLWEAAQIIIVRLCYAPAYVAYVYFEVVPAEIDFQQGASIGKLAWLLGRRYANLPQYVMLHIYPRAPLTGSAGGAFFADFYANFGMAGVVVGGIFTGALIQSIQILLLRQKKTIVSLAAYAFLFYAFWMTTSRPLQTVLLSTGTVFILLAWGALALVEKIMSPVRQKRKGTSLSGETIAHGHHRKEPWAVPGPGRNLTKRAPH